jgi:hypothetical protein
MHFLPFWLFHGNQDSLQNAPAARASSHYDKSQSQKCHFCAN